jgi:hypothetical protein
MQQQIDAVHRQQQAELNELRTRELAAAKRQADQIFADARAAAEREHERSLRQATQMAQTQQDTLAEVAATSAAEMVGQLLKQIGGPDLHAALVQSACQQVGKLPQDALAPVKVESALPLAADQRAALDAALGPAATGADYRTVGELGAGVRLMTAQGLIDASASGLATFARQALIQEMNLRTNSHNPLLMANHD